MAFLAALGTALGASAATAAATGLAAIGAGAGVFSVLGTIQSGRAQAQAMRLQATQTQLQGRQNALNYNRQAIQVFERQQRLAGTIRARAAAAGIDPLTGSPMTLDQVNAMTAGREMEIARENAEMSIYGGLAQSQSLQAAASTTMTQGITGGLMNLGLAAAGMAKTATPSAAGLPSWYTNPAQNPLPPGPIGSWYTGNP